MLKNERGIKELGQTYHSLKEMIVDMDHSLIKAGVVPRPKKLINIYDLKIFLREMKFLCQKHSYFI